MEAAKEQESGGLLDKILPPRLEDAGLEDCALPPDSIKEAFYKAASAVKSRATSIFTDTDEEDEEEEPDNCIQDPFREGPTGEVVGLPLVQGSSDTLVGVDTGTDAPGTCVVEKGVVEEGVDKVVLGGVDVEEREKEKGGCVEIGVKKKTKKEKNGDENEGESESEEKPILTEGFVSNPEVNRR